MTNEQRPLSWWQTLPGILTAVAAILTAVTGLVVALNQTGLLDRRSESGRDPDTPAEAQAAGERGTGPEQGSKAAEPPSGEKHWIDMKAFVTMKDGSTLELDAPTLSYCIGNSPGIQILNNLTYQFSSMKSLEVLGANDPYATNSMATVRLTLRDGKVVEGKTSGNCPLFGHSGENKSGDIYYNKLSRIDFR